MSEGELRRLHTKNIGKLIVYVTEVLGYEMQLEEGFIDPVRKRDDNGKPVVVLTQEQYHHKLDGIHPKGRANDISLFVKGNYIASSSHPAYQVVIKYWLSLHPFCKSGIVGNDANHYSTDPGSKW